MAVSIGKARVPINGVDFKYNRGILWEHAAGGLTFYRSDFATYVNGMCYRVAMRMSVRDASGATGNPPLPLPNRADLDIELILDVLTTFKVSPQADGVMDTPAPCQTHSAELVISTAQQQASVGDAIEINVTFHNTGCALLGLPRYYLMVEQEPDLPALLPQEIAPVDHSLAVPPEGSDQVTFLLQAAAPGNATLSATVSFEAHLGYPGPAYWATASSEKTSILVSPR